MSGEALESLEGQGKDSRPDLSFTASSIGLCKLNSLLDEKVQPHMARRCGASQQWHGQRLTGVCAKPLTSPVESEWPNAILYHLRLGFYGTKIMEQPMQASDGFVKSRQKYQSGGLNPYAYKRTSAPLAPCQQWRN